MASSGGSAPDFICVGMPKAGTGWLFDQLQFHPDFWMTPLKGLRYLDHETPQIKFARRRLKRLEKNPGAGRADRRGGDERDRMFLEEAASLSGRPRDIRKYGALFRFKGDRFSGDVCAVYYSLDENVIAEVAHVFPKVKIVLLIRDPVARAWSNVSMAHREGRFDAHLLNDMDGFRAWIAQSSAIGGKMASEIASRWRRAAPQVQFRHFFFDDMEADPAGARREILSYLGADPARSGPLSPGHNRKASAAKLPLNETIRAALVSHLEQEIRACAELFGGHARNWMERHGLSR